MAMRRRSFRRFSRPRRRGAGLRNSTRPLRWSVGNFRFENNIQVNTATPDFNVVTVIAAMQNFGTSSPAGFLAVPQMARSLEIGGIVFHFTVTPYGTDDLNADPATLPEWYFTDNRLLLCSDRVDDSGTPASILTPWGESTLPTVSITSLDNLSEDEDFPTRIHWQEGRSFQHGFSTLLATGRPLAQAPVAFWHGTRSKRLKLRLTDESILTFHQFVHLGNTAPIPGDDVFVNVSFRVQGTLYYRVRF